MGIGYNTAIMFTHQFEQPAFDADVLTRETAFSPREIWEKYPQPLKGLIADDVDKGKLLEVDRKEYWQNYYTFLSYADDEIAATINSTAETGQPQAIRVDLPTVIKRAMWRIRKDLDVEIPADLSWEDHLENDVVNPQGEMERKYGLDKHHVQAQTFAQEVLEWMQVAGSQAITPEMVVALPDLVGIHDQLKFLSLFGKKGQHESDHEILMQLFLVDEMPRIMARYQDQAVFTWGNQNLTGPEGDSQLLNKLAAAVGNHENIYEEFEWLRRALGEDGTDPELADIMKFFVIIDTNTDGLEIVEEMVAGKGQATKKVLRLKASELDRILDLMHRHLLTGVVETEGKDPAKAYLPSWVLLIVPTLVTGLQFLADEIGAELDESTIPTLTNGAINVVSNRIELLKHAQESGHRGLEENIADLSDLIKRLDDYAEYHQVPEIIGRRPELNGFIEAIRMVSESTYQRMAGNLDWQYSQEHSKLVGRETMLDQDLDLEGNNVRVLRNLSGFIQLLRLLAYMQSEQKTVKTIGFRSDAHKKDGWLRNYLEMIVGSVNGSGETNYFETYSKFFESGTQGAYVSYAITNMMFTANLDENRPPLFFEKEIMAASADWSQIVSAAKVVLHLLESESEINIETVAGLLNQKETVLQIAQAAEQGYYESLQQRAINQKWAPDKLEAKIEQLSITFSDETRSEVTMPDFDFQDATPFSNEQKYQEQVEARIAYVKNQATIIALQTAVIEFSNKSGKSPYDILSDIAEGRFNQYQMDDLLTMAKSCYVQATIASGEYFERLSKNNPVRLDSMWNSAVADASLDSRQVQIAARMLHGVLTTGDIPAVLEVPVAARGIRILKDMGREAVQVNVGSSEADVANKLQELGIKRPDLTFFFSGGAAEMESTEASEQFIADLVTQLSAAVNERVADGTETLNLLVVTGGTQSGFMELIGKVCQELQTKFKEQGLHVDFQVLGVCPSSQLRGTTLTKAGYEVPPAEGHTHYLLADTSSIGVTGAIAHTDFGDETNIMRHVLRCVSSQRKDVAFGLTSEEENEASLQAEPQPESVFGVTSNGGPLTAEETKAMLELGVQDMILKDSNRWANTCLAVSQLDAEIVGDTDEASEIEIIRQEINGYLNNIVAGNLDMIPEDQYVFNRIGRYIGYFMPDERRKAEFVNLLKLLNPSDNFDIGQGQIIAVDAFEAEEVIQNPKNLLLAILYLRDAIDKGLVQILEPTEIAGELAQKVRDVTIVEKPEAGMKGGERPRTGFLFQILRRAFGIV